MGALATAPVLHAPRKLDIGAGQQPGPIAVDKAGRYLTNADGKWKREPGWTGIDIMPGSDIEWNLWDYPWPIATGVVREVYIGHFVEHIPHWRPQWPDGKDGWFLFFEEVSRICRKGATIKVIHPYLKTDRAFWDPSHVRFIPEQAWFYLNREWRETNDLGHYTDCDFDVTVAFAGLYGDMEGRPDAYVLHNQQHSWNVHPDLMVTLTKR